HTNWNYLDPDSHIGSNEDPYKEYQTKIESYQNSLKMLKQAWLKIQSILCHDPLFRYDPDSDTVIYDIVDSRIFWVACPVDVKVLKPDGQTLAVLSDTASVIPDGYEGMFYVIETEAGSGDYMKVAVVPKDHQIVIEGNDNGTMDILVMDYTQGELTLKETYQDVPVTADTQATFEYASDHESETENDDSGLILNGTSYDELQRKSDSIELLLGAATGGVVVMILGIIIKLRKRKKQPA
ncbi:MAG: hypothetical protein IJY28_09545, partial [Clostridia bacterium]|nr:hypothetical protein [Clostridia bacterium]